MIGSSQNYVVENIKLVETLNNKNVSDIPKLRDLKSDKNPIVDKINARILDIFMIESFVQKEIEEFRWFDVQFNSEVKENILYINYSGEYYGAYPNFVEGEIYFSLESGEILTYENIPIQSLFTLTGYLDFLNKYWLQEVKKEFKEATECADFEPHCSYYDIEYLLKSKQLSLSLTNDCYPRVSLACSPEYNISIELDSIKKYLNEVGKYICFQSNYSANSPVERFKENLNLKEKLDNNIFIFAVIENSDSISMAINVDDNIVNGFYYYDKEKEKIKLKGEKKGDKILVVATKNKKATGYFEFLISNEYHLNSFLLSEKNGKEEYIAGKWLNVEKTKTNNLIFTEIKNWAD